MDKKITDSYSLRIEKSLITLDQLST